MKNKDLLQKLLALSTEQLEKPVYLLDSRLDEFRVIDLVEHDNHYNEFIISFL